MQDQEKSRDQLIAELNEIRLQVSSLEASLPASSNKLSSEKDQRIGHLEAIVAQGEQRFRLLFLDFSKMEAGKFELITTDFSLRDRVDNTMSTMAV